MIIMITNIRPTHQASEYSFKSNICSKSTFNGTFSKNLNNLFSSLLSSINATTSTGFYSSSYGEIPDKVYAIGFCRGDLKPSACAACLAASTALIVKNACPDAKNGGVGSINCTLRYSNISISGIRVEAPSISGYSHGDNVSSSSRFDFNQRLTTLFETLRSKAAAGSVLKFAVGHSNAPVSSGITIYGLAQCSPDLSETDCSVCISKGLKQLPPCCYKSWSYLGASCSLRYDPDLFYDPATDPTPLPPPSPPPATTPLPPPSPPPATTTSNSGGIESGTSRMVITTLVPVVVSMFLIVSHSLSNDLVYFFVQFV
ncbi:putative cysteine-rich receptor-like protein kinase 9 isoform X1 [Rosa chinensis]|uniref:putative cysteine-rich receptor-like protein kinase 9 isoform X1 n=1 Tax=Rosa chinensis TaxID=74649 RepID=UPI000D08F1EF|nr:putative cysteine-rich receptor-like protein kinase 9 isoform X1 [Rosa chinensis]